MPPKGQPRIIFHIYVSYHAFRASGLPKGRSFVKISVCVFFFTKSAAHKMNRVYFFNLFELQGFEKPPLLSKDAFVYFFTTRAAYKMSKVWLFKLFELQGFQKFPLFSKEVKRADYKMSKVYIFELFKLQSFQKSSLLSEDVFE